MDRRTLNKRLQELGIYSDFYYRKELKLLSQVLKEGEQLNCLFTGLHEANRKMVAVTDSRILILFSAALADKAVVVIKREAVEEYTYTRKFLVFADVRIRTKGGEEFLFTGAQPSLKDLFEWAMKQPLPSH